MAEKQTILGRKLRLPHLDLEPWARFKVEATLLVPISVLANVLRVLFIALLTYHQGNAVGQSFVHELSGLFLFVVALLLIIGLDGLLDRLGLACQREVTP